jgi:hypothetical protein
MKKPTKYPNLKTPCNLWNFAAALKVARGGTQGSRERKPKGAPVEIKS